eukprot:CAMPEP_0172375302 /NCGR_PEP_ID=MMETSP1060-20121228/60898_1 /TAXON_ID=37318 /ORGANISM="Pseudo-nitzschia pungens, Strain cf. cingulata" /LENGTH=79 /DNA_ID=CAMNT_0013102373 /DNA_START=69 /DNA_END=304 /DNA_ORIENTATION=-
MPAWNVAVEVPRAANRGPPCVGSERDGKWPRLLLLLMLVLLSPGELCGMRDILRQRGTVPATAPNVGWTLSLSLSLYLS